MSTNINLHPKGENHGGIIMIAKKLHRVTLKKEWEPTITGRMGLVWLEHSLRDFGFEQITGKYYKSKANKEIKGTDKIMAGALSIISGAERMEDLEQLRADIGLQRNIGVERIMSADTMREFLKEKGNNNKQEKINEALTIKSMKQSGEKEFTYDNDATYMDTGKDCAQWSYQGSRQMSGLLGYIAELGICATVDYRRGNISPADGVIEQLCRVIRMAKKAKKRISIFRSDSVAYTNEIIKLCNRENIKYYISARKAENVKALIRSVQQSEWQELPIEEAGDREYTERLHITQKGVVMRLLIIRWKKREPDLFEDKYCYHAIATNDNQISITEWLKIHNGRMKSENYHKEIKHGFNGGYTPSNDFEMSRGYFLLNVLAYNMVQIFKLFYLGKDTVQWTIKTLRYRFLCVCGKIVKTGRRYYCKIINVVDSVYELFERCLACLIVQH